MPLRLAAVEAAIVDLDGTLVDTLPDFTIAVNAMLAALALPTLEAAQVERMVGKGSEHLVRSALQAAGGAASAYDAAWTLYQRHYGQVNGRHARVYPGAAEGLQALHRAGLRLACVTNKPTRFARALLQDKGLDRWFAQVAGGDAFERKKPDPLPLLHTCAALEVPTARTLVVGDSSNDAAAARAAGCPVVLVTYGYNHGRPVREVDADAFVDSMADLAALLPKGA